MSAKAIKAELSFWDVQLTPTYVQRKANALAAGFTSTQARGHAKATELALTDVRKAVKAAGDPNLARQNWLLVSTYKAQLKGDGETVRLYKAAKKAEWKKDPFWNEPEAPMTKLINRIHPARNKTKTKFKRGNEGESPVPITESVYNNEEFEAGIDTGTLRRKRKRN